MRRSIDWMPFIRRAILALRREHRCFGDPTMGKSCDISDEGRCERGSSVCNACRTYRKTMDSIYSRKTKGERI